MTERSAPNPHRHEGRQEGYVTDPEKLSVKERRFVDAYLVDPNGTKAAIAAGYAAPSAHVTASRLLRRANVLAAIAKVQQAATAVVVERTGVDRAWVLEQLVVNYERAMQAEEVVMKDGTRTGEYVYNGAVANRALELIGKDIGMFADRLQVEDLDRMTEEELSVIAKGQAPPNLKIA